MADDQYVDKDKKFLRDIFMQVGLPLTGVFDVIMII
jgi:hypothetical protein